MIIFFIFRRPIIAGWGRDMGTNLRPIRNLIWICGWRFDRLVNPIKIKFMGSPTIRPITCMQLVVSQPLGAPNQYRAPNLKSSWPWSNTTQLTEKYNHLSAEYTELKANHEYLRQIVMNMASQSGDPCVPPPFFPFNNQPPPPLAPPSC